MEEEESCITITFVILKLLHNCTNCIRRNGTIFDETTAGNPIKTKIVSEVQPVEAEEDEECTLEASDYTAGAGN